MFSFLFMTRLFSLIPMLFSCGKSICKKLKFLWYDVNRLQKPCHLSVAALVENQKLNILTQIHR